MKRILLIPTLLICNLLLGQKVTQNKNYVGSDIQSIALTPFFDEQGSPDVNMNQLFSDSFSSSFEICCQKDIEHNLMNHSIFNELAGKYLYIDLSPKIKTSPNLFSRLNEVEILELKKGFKNVDLLIVTSSINKRTVSKVNGSGNITFSSNITAFDLRTGEFVAHISHKIKKKFENIPQAKEPLQQLVNSFSNELTNLL